MKVHGGIGLIIDLYFICAGTYGLISLLLILRRSIDRAAVSFFVSCLFTAGWAIAGAFNGDPPLMMLTSSISIIAWVIFICCLLAPPNSSIVTFFRRTEFAMVVPVVSLVTVGLDIEFFFAGTAYGQGQLIGRLAVVVAGIWLIENLYRKAEPDDRWRLRPLCIGLGSIFAFDLYYFSDALLLRHVDAALVAARVIIMTSMGPLLVLTIARNKTWHPRIRVSREAAFHGATLIASGIFLLSVAIIGSIFRRYGGEWALVLQVSALFGSAMVLLIVLTSGTAQSHIRNFVLKNFFPYRFDYRVEWIKFIEMLSLTEPDKDLADRVVRAIADILNCPGGALFQIDDNNFAPVAQWNVTISTGTRERSDSPFIIAFKGGNAIQQLTLAEMSEIRPRWMTNRRFWLAIPLLHNRDLIGFVLLNEPRASYEVDWEVLELLHTVARQAASYLAQQAAANALADARMLEDFSKRFAFVIHDIKNLSSQLELVVTNAQIHGSNPEFKADAMQTIANSVTRMNKLLSQLRAQRQTEVSFGGVNVVATIRELLTSHPARERIRFSATSMNTHVRIDQAHLFSALSHLLDNAVEASGTKGKVAISVTADRAAVIIDVADEGSGMEAGFVRNGLFRPFRTTKRDGFGIGAFQTREILRAAGGSLEVVKSSGLGTTMRITLAAINEPSQMNAGVMHA